METLSRFPWHVINKNILACQYDSSLVQTIRNRTKFDILIPNVIKCNQSGFVVEL